MNIESAQYHKSITSNEITSIKVKLEGHPNSTMNVPLDPSNSDYAEIMRQAKEEGLTIKDAE
jgi:hypothetical protein